MLTSSSDDVHAVLRTNSYLRVIARAYVAHAIGVAIIVGTAGVVWKLPLNKLVVSYIVLVVVASGISVSMWTMAQPVRARAQAYAIRVALGALVYTVMLIAALLCDAAWVGIVSQAEGLRLLPSLVNAAVLISFLLYVVLRKLIPARQARSTGPSPDKAGR